MTRNSRSSALKSALHVYRLPENATSHQPLIERAEEDLLCALALYRQGACGYLPLVTVCYTPADIEQYIKVLIPAVFRTRRLAKQCLGDQEDTS